jgi:hypothetical protein
MELIITLGKGFKRLLQKEEKVSFWTGGRK